MNAVKFLFAAYLATWLIHGFYMGTLLSRFRRLRREIDELHKSPGSNPKS